ncbi:Uncharacterized protein FWK35_00031746 [Aphis craccivora]|uniref:SAP domain-containing protein n=1 Tax=Aphis craccivora TaxID=307492 RepID=A0A6G0YH96_APHCR|nr:Uncharacterized protein FWK35_00031746 [Aphis craccivora]
MKVRIHCSGSGKIHLSFTAAHIFPTDPARVNECRGCVYSAARRVDHHGGKRGSMSSVRQRCRAIRRLRNTLNSFQSIDLQTLLEAFGQNKVNRKTELQDRAIEYLRTRSAN